MSTTESNEDSSKKNKKAILELTKTRAKKSLWLVLKKDQKKSLLKEIKKKYSPSITLNKVKKSTTDEPNTIKYLVEFQNYKLAKEAKSNLEKLFKDNKAVKIDSALTKKKKEIRKDKKQQINNEPKPAAARNGQHTNLSKDLFEITMPKLILRNISFRLNEEILKTHMEKYGPVKLINLPKKEDGKLSGYGFVVFENMKCASKALEKINASDEKIMGTKIAADWCLPKNLFLKSTKIDENKAEKENDSADDKENEEDSEKESASDDDDDDDEEKDDAKNKKKSKKRKLNPEKEEVNNIFEEKRKAGTKDVLEQRTIFVRNLSFETRDESLREEFLRFGPIKYARICLDKDLERPKGTAFVQFENSQSASDALAESGKFELDGRTIYVDLAMSREKVGTVVGERKSDLKKGKDTRNLVLAKEGLIYENSYEGKELSKSDLMRRQKIQIANEKKLKLLHYFVSPTRLSVHNIPLKCTDEELRKIFANAIKNESKYTSSPEIRSKNYRRDGIVECRIMRDLSRVTSDGVYKSRGYGFVEFINQDLALKALHATNNNPNIFGNDARLIVQFSIENINAIKKKSQRLAKSKFRLNKPKVN